jgi:hypothetical protein
MNRTKKILCAFLKDRKDRSVFSHYFSIGKSNQKNFLLHNPCHVTCLSSREQWEIFSLIIEKIDFKIFYY